MAVFTLAAVCATLIAVSASWAAETSTDISSRIAQQQADLAKSRTELDHLNQEIGQQEMLLSQNRSDLADATSLLREAEDRYDASLRRFNERISAIYKLGESEFYAIMLSSEDFTEAITRLSYLGTISENDLKLLEEVHAQEREVRALHERVDYLKQDRAQNLDDLRRQKLELENQISTGQKKVYDETDELLKVRAREQEEEARRAEEASQGDDASLYAGVLGPSIVVGAGPPAGLQPTGTVLSGVASWYGPGFHGNRTANGEIYNQYGLTAAHKTLPFGTWLKVTFNGRSVFVRINDRGPYIPGRFLDLSAGGAQAIGLTGIGYVTAEIYR